MDHLTREQLEDVLAGRVPLPEHLQTCGMCRARLEEHKALADRLRKAFDSVHAGDALAGQIHGALHIRALQSQGTQVKIGLLARHRRLVSSLAAAAALLVVLVPVGLYLGTASRVQAAQTELMQIHRQNLEGSGDLLRSSDPNEIRDYFEDRLGYAPVSVRSGEGLQTEGCCVRRYRDKEVPTVVIQTPQGTVSLVVLTALPKDLGMQPMPGSARDGRTVWQAVCEFCNMAAIHIGDRTYYVMGSVSHAHLAEVLAQFSAVVP